MHLSAASQRSAKVDLGAIVAHVLRAKTLDVLSQRTASPTEIAHELHEPVHRVAYHVKKLLEVDAIELVDERPVRGAVEHFYRARVIPAFGEQEWSDMTPEQRKEFSTYTIQLGLAAIARALDSGTFDDRPDRCLTRTPLQVDEQGWVELSDLHHEMFHRTMQIRVDSANRVNGDESVPTIKTIQLAMFFEEP